MIDKDELLDAFELVNNFRFRDIKKGIFNTFPLSHYKVPRVDGIQKEVYDKGINQVKPNTLKYIIFNLHNVDENIIIEAIVVLLYCYKKKQETKTMREVFKRILHHYTVANKEENILLDIKEKAIVYSISFDIGSITYNKFGYTTDKKRLVKLLSDIKSKYPHVNVGNFKVNQTIQFKTEQQAKMFEKEALKNMKLNVNYRKCKNLFDGYTESYLNI